MSMSVEAQKKGKMAENRVAITSKELGMEVEYNPELDYGAKTDLLVNGQPIQVSCGRKSNRALKTLKQRGILPVVAGKKISDSELISELLKLNS